MATYKMDEMDFIEQFVILGVSRYSDSDSIVKAMDVLNTLLAREANAVYAVIDMLLKISESGHSCSQDAIFLCLVMCCVHSAVGKTAICEKINSLCRIPTHLFVFLKMLKEYMERGGSNTTQYYDSLLKHRGSAPQLGKRKKQHENEKQQLIEGDITPIKMSAFISKHKFICKWYSDEKKTAQDLLLLLTKYSKREGFDHATLIKYSHPKFHHEDKETDEKNIVIRYCLNGYKKIKKEIDTFDESKNTNQVLSRVLHYIEALESVKKAANEDDGAIKIAELVQKYKRQANDVFQGGDIQFTVSASAAATTTGDRDDSEQIISDKLSRLHLVFENLPNKMFNEKRVWDELIKDMPKTSMLRNVSHMSYLGMFEEEENVQIIEESFSNQHRLYPFIHPFNMLKTIFTYRKGASGYKEDRKWSVNVKICEILHNAFFLSLKRTSDLYFQSCVICIDASQSMHQNGFLGFEMFTAAIGSVAIATAIDKLGTNISISICGRETKNLEGEQLLERLDEIKSYADEKTNLSLPIREAITNKTRVEAFIIFTKSVNESMCGESVYETYKEYQSTMKEVNTKLVIVSMEASHDVIVDVQDPSVRIVCGGDADVLPIVYKHITNGE